MYLRQSRFSSRITSKRSSLMMICWITLSSRFRSSISNRKRNMSSSIIKKRRASLRKRLWCKIISSLPAKSTKLKIRSWFWTTKSLKSSNILKLTSWNQSQSLSQNLSSLLSALLLRTWSSSMRKSSMSQLSHFVTYMKKLVKLK